MERLERISRVASVFFAAAVITAAMFKHQLLDGLIENIAEWTGHKISPISSSALAVIILSAAFAALESGMHASIRRWRWVRRLLLRSDDIEGVWIDRVRQGDTLLNGAFLSIKYKNGEFIVTGDEWAPDGKHIHKFWSEYSKYENNTLRFVFTSTEGARKLEGSAEYRFSTHGGKPMGFSGFYVENDTGKTTELEGVRAENLVENLEEPRFFDVKFQQKLVDRYVKSASP
jgi:hypothetical protein